MNRGNFLQYGLVTFAELVKIETDDASKVPYPMRLGGGRLCVFLLLTCKLASIVIFSLLTLMNVLLNGVAN